MPVVDDTRAGTNPVDAARIIDTGERNDLAGDIGMSVVSVLDFYNVVYDFDLSGITAEYFSRVREAGFDVSRRPHTSFHKEFTDSGFCGAGEIQPFRYLGAD